MIIDLRTRIWSSLEQFGSEIATRLRTRYADRWEQLDGSIAAHERAMSCVDGACVFGFRSQMLGAAVPNELVAEFVSGDPGRRIGVAGIDPVAPGAEEDLDQAIHLGLAAVAMSPSLQGFHPSHSAAMRIYERCCDLGIPVFLVNDLPMTRSAIMEFARPSSVDEVARCLPDLRIVIGEFGYPWVTETVALIGKHENVFTDVACISSRQWELYQALLVAAGNDVMSKVLFGSGFPRETPESAIERLYSINSYSHGTHLPSVPRSLVRGVVECDSLALLGIDIEGRRGDRRSVMTSEAIPGAVV